MTTPVRCLIMTTESSEGMNAVSTFAFRENPPDYMEKSASGGGLNNCSTLIFQEKHLTIQEGNGGINMQKMTSAIANKMLRSLEDEKSYWLDKEANSKTYVAATNEEPVIPEYDYVEVSATIAALDEKIATIKHALNLTNATAKIMVGDTEMSVDTILIRMSQLNRRKSTLDQMRKALPKTRQVSGFGSRNPAPEYMYLNYDLAQVKQDYEKVSGTIMEMQLALDKYNQTVLFDVEI